MPGRWYNELHMVAEDRYGYVTAADLAALGGGREILTRMKNQGDLIRVAHGLYRFATFPRGPRDEYMEATLWPRGLGVISHESALDLWELCDVNPTQIHVTVPMNERIRRQRPGRYAVHRRELDPSDIDDLEGIAVVTPTRAILDGIASHLDGRLIDQALNTAGERGLIDDAQATTIQGAR